jgi:type I restriction enzyme S subunit
MSDSSLPLPIGWVTSDLGALIEFKYGKALPDRERSGLGFPVFGSNGIVGRHSLPLTKGPTIIIGRKGSVGQVHFSTESCSPIDTTYYIDTVPGECFKFWHYQLRSLGLSDLNKSTAIPGLSRTDAYKLVVRFPPLIEQRRIADKLDTVLTRVDAINTRLARVAPLLKRFRQSVLAAATSGRLTEDWRAATTNQENEDDALPAGWLRLTLRKSGRVSTGSTPPKAQSKFYGGDVPFVKPGDLDKGVIRKTDDTLTQAGSAEARMVRPGAVFVSCIGNLGKVGVAGLPMAFNQQINAVEFDSSVVTDRFGYFTCMTLGPWLLENSSATTISIVNKGRFEQVEINVPPLNEQAEIVRRVETLFAFADRLEARLQAAQTTTNRLTPSLLAKAFRGELVPQDPNDEPASELLKRLAAQEPTSKKKRPGRQIKSR